MSEAIESALSLAFMRSHPAQAARVLEALPIDEAQRVFGRVPARIGAVVMAAMLPRPAANCLAALPDARVLELLSVMPLQSLVSVLRCLPQDRRSAVIGGLQAASALAASIQLGYNEDTLGAWADPGVLMLPPEARAAEALERVRVATSSHGSVFVTDAQRGLLGLVDLTELLRAPGAATLATLMRKPPATLMALALLRGAEDDAGWALASALPVVEASRRMVGVMTYDALIRALHHHDNVPAGGAEAATMPGLLAGGYWRAVAGMAGAVLSLLPPVAPVQVQAREASLQSGAAHER
jgi:magnesium transporter